MREKLLTGERLKEELLGFVSATCPQECKNCGAELADECLAAQAVCYIMELITARERRIANAEHAKALKAVGKWLWLRFPDYDWVKALLRGEMPEAKE